MMTASISDSRLESCAPRLDSLDSAFVLLAMTLVTLACGLGLHLQLGLSVWLAVVVALSMYGALVSGHVLLRRSESVSGLNDIVGRLEGELAAWKREAAIAFAHEPQPSVHRSRANSDFSEPQALPADAASATTQLAGPPPLDRTWASNGDLSSPKRDSGPTPTREVDHGHASHDGIKPPAPASQIREFVASDRTFGLASTAEAVADPLAAHWPVKPARDGADVMPGAFAGPRWSNAVARPPKNAEAVHWYSNQAMSDLADARTGGSGPETLSAPIPAAVFDADVEHIHGVIKMLAEELRAAKSSLPAPQSLANSETAFAAPVQALKMVAETMRAMVDSPALAAGPAGPTRQSGSSPVDVQGLPVPPSVAPAHRLLQEIADAVAAARLEVYIEPILGLPDLRARHYEVSFRLRTTTGASMSSEEFTPVARGTGLLPLIDSMSVSRSARVAVSLNDRGAAGSLFSPISGESLASTQFLREFADTYHQSETIAERLVLSFAQNDVRCFAAPQWAMLNELADLGFRFALEDVSDLDMDFETLSAAGFAFAKFDASVFLEGLPARDRLIPAADLCRHLAGLGLTLIVGRVEEDMQLAKVLGFGAVFGQGMLFGAPRAVKGEILRHTRGAAA